MFGKEEERSHSSSFFSLQPPVCTTTESIIPSILYVNACEWSPGIVQGSGVESISLSQQYVFSRSALVLQYDGIEVQTHLKISREWHILASVLAQQS